MATPISLLGLCSPRTRVSCIPSPPASHSFSKKVLVPVAFGTEEMEAVILVDVLRRAGADVTVASVENGLEIQCSSRTRLLADTFVSTIADDTFDLVVLPGGMPGSPRLRECKVLEKVTRRQAEEKRLYGAISTAPPTVLGPWGLMKGKEMTCHPGFMHKLPTFWKVESNVQVSDELTTSRGPGTAFDFALSFVQQLFGDGHAGQIKEELLVETNNAGRMEEFNETGWSFDHSPRILVPVANGSEEIEVVTIVDILRRAKADVLIASVESSLQIIACQDTKIIADLLIDDACELAFDGIILPGGSAGAERLHKSKVLKKLLKEQKKEGRIYGAAGSSPLTLQKQRLLENKRVAANAGIVDKLKCSVTDGGVVIDERLITCRGLSTVVPFSLSIVSKIFGHATARSIASAIVFKYPSS